jgi:hypothetical protein
MGNTGPESDVRPAAPGDPGGRLRRPGGAAGQSQREVFLEQVAHCEGRSPLYADLCRRFADDPRVEAIADRWKPRDPLRLLGGLHYLVLGGEASWDAVDEALERHEDFLRRFVAEQPVQTNEVQRSWVLLPLFLQAAGDSEAVDVVELGASAGLNLVWDRYRYRYERGEWGPPEAPLTLAGDERRPLPGELFRAGPRVRSRIGIDLSPVDATTPEGARLLKSFVWAGQGERLERLERAIAMLRPDPPTIVRGDVAQALPGVLDGLPRDGLTLLFQTGVLGYLTQEGREQVRDVIDRADRDLVFVSSGSPRTERRAWGMRIYRPGEERVFVGHADYHGTWLDYEL